MLAQRTETHISALDASCLQHCSTTSAEQHIAQPGHIHRHIHAGARAAYGTTQRPKLAEHCH
eukprot:10993276-Alexandrium_andersonii.AAC.1